MVYTDKLEGVKFGQQGYSKSGGVAINARLRQINTPSDKKGRVNLEDVEPGRTAEIAAGKSNVAAGQILIFDADGDPNKISKSDNDRTDNVGWDIKYITGRNEKEKNCSVSLGVVGDDKFDYDGDAVPFEAIREEADAKRHFNVAHFRYTGGNTGTASFRQWRVAGGIRYESNWVGASDGNGLRFGAQ